MMALLLAGPSFVWHHVVRAVCSMLVESQQRRHPELARQWRVLSKTTLESPLALPVILTTAPRWNPHAVIATLGPLAVSHEIRIRVDSANRTAGRWTFVIYAMPGRRTIAAVGPWDRMSADGWVTVPLAPGRYGIVSRYYQTSGDVELPEVEADGEHVADTRRHENPNSFYDDLRSVSNPLLTGLNYYVWPLLRYRRLFAERFVSRQYLPVGNPETEFAFGALRRGESVRVEVAANAVDKADVYVTMYNLASIPQQWFRAETRVVECPAGQTGTVLVRTQWHHEHAADLHAVQLFIGGRRCMP